MTSLTAFDCRLGLSQGRMPLSAPSLGAPSLSSISATGSGDFIMVLGDAKPGRLYDPELSRLYDLAPGDYAEVTQPVDVTAADLLRAALYLRVPADVPPGMAWEVSLVVDGAKLARAICRPGRARALTDLAANVSKLAGIHVVGVRLQLVGV